MREEFMSPEIFKEEEKKLKEKEKERKIENYLKGVTEENLSKTISGLETAAKLYEDFLWPKEKGGLTFKKLTEEERSIVMDAVPSGVVEANPKLAKEGERTENLNFLRDILIRLEKIQAEKREAKGG